MDTSSQEERGKREESFGTDPKIFPLCGFARGLGGQWSTTKPKSPPSRCERDGRVACTIPEDHFVLCGGSGLQRLDVMSGICAFLSDFGPHEPLPTGKSSLIFAKEISDNELGSTSAPPP